MDISNDSFNTAITDSEEHIIGIIDETLDEYKKQESFDIREYMDHDKIRRLLINHPSELSLFEVTCILINDKIKKN
jgi:hypothetical protein